VGKATQTLEAVRSVKPFPTKTQGAQAASIERRTHLAQGTGQWLPRKKRTTATNRRVILKEYVEGYPHEEHMELLRAAEVPLRLTGAELAGSAGGYERPRCYDLHHGLRAAA
jgi:predicted extracellular nuclease